MKTTVAVVALGVGILLSGCSNSEETVPPAPTIENKNTEQQPEGAAGGESGAEEADASSEYGLWSFLEEESSLGENKFVFTLRSETDEDEEMALAVSCNPGQTLLVGVLLSSSSFQFSSDPSLEVQVRFDDGPLEDWHAYVDGPFAKAFSPNELPSDADLLALDLQFLNKLSGHDTFGVRVIDLNGGHTAKFPITGVRAIAEKVSASNCVPQ